MRNAGQICSKCVMGIEDDPFIKFDSAGICNYCRSYEKTAKKMVFTGEEGERKLASLVRKIKNKGKNEEYDCVLGISGGVDSTYLAYWAKQLGLRPLAVHLDNGWNSELATKNIENIIRKLGFDLHTVVVDWEEFKDLQIAYFKASVVDIEVATDHAIIATLYHIAAGHGIKYILNGANYTTEGFLPMHWIFDKTDLQNLRAIHARYGTIGLKTYPTISYKQRLYYRYVANIKDAFLLNYMTYNKDEAKKIIMDELGWRDYGYKHYESIFTRFYQAYILPRKFNIDKRRSHFSTLICSGQLTREQALEELSMSTETTSPDEDKDYVVKKLGLTEETFTQIMTNPINKHTDFPHSVHLFASLKSTVKSLLKPILQLH